MEDFGKKRICPICKKEWTSNTVMTIWGDKEYLPYPKEECNECKSTKNE
jgi:hypothetical protein